MTKILTLLFIPIILFGCKQKEEKTISDENSTSINKPLILNDSTSIKKVFNQDDVIFIDDSAYYKKDSTLINGEVIRLNENGKNKELKTYKHGILDGPRKVWFDNGQLQQEGIYENGVIEGTRTIWYDTGELKMIGTYSNNIINGSVKSWYTNGELKSESNYKNGRLEGVVKSYNEDGTVKEERRYKDGKKIE